MTVLSLACADINKIAASDLIRFIDVFERRTGYYSNNAVLDANRNKRVSFVSIFSLCDIDIYERDHKSTFLMLWSFRQSGRFYAMAGSDVRFLPGVQPRVGDGNDLFTQRDRLDYPALADGAGFRHDSYAQPYQRFFRAIT